MTLDPLLRQVRLSAGPQILLSDTVGFIDRLPHSLVAAFRATLEEVVQADLLLHVVDAADADRARHVEAVERVLAEIDAHEVPRLRVYNKIDRLSDAEREGLAAAEPGAVTLSAATGVGIEALEGEIARRLSLETERVRLEFDAADEGHQARIARVYRHARVVSHEAAAGRIAIEADVPRRWLSRLAIDHASR